MCEADGLHNQGQALTIVILEVTVKEHHMNSALVPDLRQEGSLRVNSSRSRQRVTVN